MSTTAVYKVVITRGSRKKRDTFMVIASDKYDAARKGHTMQGQEDGVRITVFGPEDEATT